MLEKFHLAWQLLSFFFRNFHHFEGFRYRLVKSSIALVDADPGRDKTKRAAYIQSNTDEVVFMPDTIRKKKDELWADANRFDYSVNLA